MRDSGRKLLFVLLALVAMPSLAMSPSFKDAEPPAGAKSVALVERWLHVDEDALRQEISQGLKASGGSVELELPMPYGGSKRFRLSPSEVMAPELAARYPRIQTFAGHGIDDPLDRIRFELLPQGVGAMLFGVDGVVVLQPQGKSGSYVVFQRETVAERSNLVCNVTRIEPAARSLLPHPLQHPAASPRKVVGGQLRRYRTAIATTGEYSSFHGGTKELVQAEIARAVNRVNQVFENEVGVTLQLVGNNDTVIFLDANTDPYTNDDGGAMLDQNQTTLDNLIGTANYDLGHVFSTGGGGVAATNPCSPESKAQGVTGLDTPTNDPFWIDYVAHEIGHQFGGNHTFNDNSQGGCAGDNRNQDTAFEPGSGSTIIAYAGICGTLGNQNLQNNSDPYFHVATLGEMHAETQNADGGRGGSCGTLVAAANTPPTITQTLPASPGGGAPGAVIPARTPFFLTATATDPDGDALTYAWEQLDAGAASPPVEDDGTRAIIRSYLPSSSPTRVVPRLQDLLGGTTTFGELLPTTTRILTFRVTVRDNRNGARWSGEAGQAADVRLQVQDTGAPFRITSQPAATTVTVGNAVTVTWDVSGTADAPISCAQVAIGWSVDGGNSFATNTEATFPNNGSASVTVPNLASNNQTRIRVRCASSPFFAVNAANLEVGGGTLIFRNGFEAP